MTKTEKRHGNEVYVVPGTEILLLMFIYLFHCFKLSISFSISRGSLPVWEAKRRNEVVNGNESILVLIGFDELLN